MAAYTRAPAGSTGRHPWGWVLGWTMAIFVLSALPGGTFGGLDVHGMDRVFHVGAYAVLAWFLGRALAAGEPSETAVAAWTLVAALTLGALMEWVQGFVERDPDVLDWVADAVGVMAALAARATWIGIRERWS